MGAAWCRHRAERARDPKSPLDRVIVRCVDKFYSVDSSATPVRIPKPTPGGVVASANADHLDIVPLHSVHRETSAPTRLAAGTSPWQKASLQVPRSEEARQTSSASTSAPAATSSSAAAATVVVEPVAARTPVPPPRRKRQAKRKVGVTRPPPPPRPPSGSSEPQQPSKHLLSPPKPRPKNTSTVSLPEWRELERPEPPPQPPRPASTSPRPQYLRPPSLSSVSESTLERVETYLRRCRSFGTMPSGELVDKLSSIDADSDGDDDPWDGIDDFDHAFQPAKGSPPHTPRSRVDGRNRRTGAVSSTPASVPKKSASTTSTTPATATPPSPTPTPGENGITCGRFFISSTEDEWFNREYHRDSNSASAGGPEKDLTEVKKELQSIIYDYNRTKKISTSSMEVLPTQPVRTPKKKKISVASLTPPPSPVASDPEDESSPNVPPTAVINGEANTDANTHSTLLRLLRECQNLEGALEQMGMEENEMPRVHSALRNMHENNRHLKETSKQTLRSLDSGLDVRGSLERAQEPPTSGDTTEAKKNVDSGVDDSDDLQAPQRAIKATVSDAPASVVAGGDAEGAVVRRRREARDDDGGSSSGRSSMTPSLSELEAALSDMLEKSAAAGDDDRASPIPPERIEAAATAVAAATAAAAAAGAKIPEVPPVTTTPVEPAPGVMRIPKISVTHDNAPSVH